MKLLEENTEEMLQVTGMDKNIWDPSLSKAQVTKRSIDKWNYIKLRSFSTAEETTNIMKRKPNTGENIYKLLTE